MARYSIQVTHLNATDGSIRRRYIVEIDADSRLDAYNKAWDRDPYAHRFEDVTEELYADGVCPDHPQEEVAP